jgi:hypothetical protein
MQGFDLESLRRVFEDKKLHIVIGRVTQLSIADDRSFLKCMVSVWPEEREIVTRMTWESVGPDAGIFHFPVVGDLVLVAFAEGDDDQAFVVRRLTSKEDTIPERATEGHSVIRSLAGKQAWLTSDTKVLVSRGDTEPTENFVLGQQLKTLLSDLLTELKTLCTTLSTHTHIGNLGYPTSAPVQASAISASGTEFDNQKASPVNDEEILSDLAFVEK